MELSDLGSLDPPLARFARLCFRAFVLLKILLLIRVECGTSGASHMARGLTRVSQNPI